LSLGQADVEYVIQDADYGPVIAGRHITWNDFVLVPAPRRPHTRDGGSPLIAPASR